jgi:hypothetical protein
MIIAIAFNAKKFNCAAMSRANSAQRERIRGLISSIYPDLLNLI